MKEYKTPVMEVISVNVQSPLMVISEGGPHKDDTPYEGEE